MFSLTLTLFTVTYFLLAVGRIPGLHTDRTGIAFVGASLMIATGVVPLDEAVSPRCVNFEAILLLLGMMLLVGVLQLSGFFAKITDACADRVRTPHQLLALILAASGLLSAFLVNDIVCVALTPLVLDLVRRLRFEPVPHLIALAVASNIGSAAAITGNPQNVIIGTLSKISYTRFSLKLFPVALLGLLAAYLLLSFLYRAKLVATPPSEAAPPGHAHDDSPAHRWLRAKAVAVTLATVVAFFVLPSAYLPVIALVAASVVLLDRVAPEDLYSRVDWSLLLLFAGLFVVVHGFKTHVVSTWHVDEWTWLQERPVDLLSLVSAALSNLVSNVPAVLLFQPVLDAMPPETRETAWLALAMSSTLAGNLTVLGSVANLIVVEAAARRGVRITFTEYLRAGVPLTLITLGLGVAWLMFVRY